MNPFSIYKYLDYLRLFFPINFIHLDYFYIPIINNQIKSDSNHFNSHCESHENKLALHLDNMQPISTSTPAHRTERIC